MWSGVSLTIKAPVPRPFVHRFDHLFDLLNRELPYHVRIACRAGRIGMNIGHLTIVNNKG